MDTERLKETFERIKAENPGACVLLLVSSSGGDSLDSARDTLALTNAAEVDTFSLDTLKRTLTIMGNIINDLTKMFKQLRKGTSDADYQGG